MFITLYGILIFWNTHGIDLLRVSTVARRWKITLIGLVLAVLTILGPYVYPDRDLFDFVPLTAEMWMLVAAIFLLVTLALAITMRHRRLVNRMWLLFAQ
jgi:hypothetical protein